MQPTKLLQTAVTALAVSAMPAAAATVTTELNLRSGPGLGHRVIASMPAGARIDVGRCTDNWCRVGWRGHSGYASASYISGERRITGPRWRVSAAARNPEVPRIWGYGFNEPRQPAWPIFGSAVAPDFSTSAEYPADTRTTELDGLQ